MLATTPAGQLHSAGKKLSTWQDQCSPVFCLAHPSTAKCALHAVRYVSHKQTPNSNKQLNQSCEHLACRSSQAADVKLCSSKGSSHYRVHSMRMAHDDRTSVPDKLMSSMAQTQPQISPRQACQPQKRPCSICKVVHDPNCT